METNIYNELTERYRSIEKMSGDTMERDGSEWLKDVVGLYDMVEVGLVWFGDMCLDIESVWYDNEQGEVMLHVGCKEFEGDITFVSMQTETQRKVLQIVMDEMAKIEEGPTLFTMGIGEGRMLYRLAFIPELGTEVMVASESSLKHIAEGTPEDDKFYCYVPDDKFFSMKDGEFSEYVVENFS